MGSKMIVDMCIIFTKDWFKTKNFQIEKYL